MAKHATWLGVAVVLYSASIAAQEKKIARKSLPAAVEHTVAEQSQGATIKGFSTEVEHGKHIYEMALIVDGRRKDISIDAQGRVLEVEEEVAFATLPAAVQTRLKTAARAGSITRVESLIKGGKLVAYEAVVTTGAKHREVQVGPDGKTLAHPQ